MTFPIGMFRPNVKLLLRTDFGAVEPVECVKAI